MARGSPDLDEAQGSLQGFPTSLRLIHFSSKHLLSAHCILGIPSGGGEKAQPQPECDAPTGNLSEPLCLQGAQHPQGFGTLTKEICPLSGSKRCREMAGLLVRAADPHSLCLRSRAPLSISSCKPGLLSSGPRGHNHVRHFEGKEFKPPCLTAPSISFVLLLNAVISSAHLVFCRADAVERHISDEKQSVPGSLGVKPMTPLLRRPAPCGAQGWIVPKEDQGSPSIPQLLSQVPGKSF